MVFKKGDKEMIYDFDIPVIYKKMSAAGLLNSDTILWLDDMEWIPIERIQEYEYEEGESRFIIPFAHTARDDKWVWVKDDDEYRVGLCENAEINGVYYANNTEDAIMRNIIEYLSSADFYRNKDEALSYQISEDELKKRINNWKNQLNSIICNKYIDLLESFGRLTLKKCKHENGDWDALLSYEERDDLLERYIKFDMINQEFPWFTF